MTSRNKQFKSMLESHGMTIEQAADMMGISKDTLRNYTRTKGAAGYIPMPEHKFQLFSILISMDVTWE